MNEPERERKCPKCGADLSWELSADVDCCNRCGNRFRYCPKCGRDALDSVRNGSGSCEHCECNFASYDGAIHEPYSGEQSAGSAGSPPVVVFVLIGLGIQYLVGLNLVPGSNHDGPILFLMMQSIAFGIAGLIVGSQLRNPGSDRVSSSLLGMMVGVGVGVCFGLVGCSMGLAGRF